VLSSVTLSVLLSGAIVGGGTALYLAEEGVRFAPSAPSAPAATTQPRPEQGTVTSAESSASLANLAQTEDTIVNIVERASPAVVSVVVTQEVPVFERYWEEVRPFDGLFGPDVRYRVPRERQEGTREQEVGGGSGFFVSPDGLIVTNRHVVDLPDATYSILTNEGESFEVEVLARDDVLDIAILKAREVPRGGFPHLSFGPSDAVKPGQTAIAIGNALGEFRNSVSVGVISGLSRSIVAGDGMGMAERLDEVIQTDAAINPGNSGGPLLNSRGQVVGVNVAVAFGSENIGFAIPADVVADTVASVEEFGEIQRPFLGVRYATVNERIAEIEDLPVEYGALIVEGSSGRDRAVIPESPAGRAGLRAGDLITAVEVVYLRDGRERRVEVTLEKAPE
jgi:serine protease Do